MKKVMLIAAFIVANFCTTRSGAADKVVRGTISKTPEGPSGHSWRVRCDGSEGTCYRITEDGTTIFYFPEGTKTCTLVAPPTLDENPDGTFTQVGEVVVIETGNN